MFSLDSPIGFDGMPNMNRRRWTPKDLGSIVCESWCDTGVTLHGTPRATGTSPGAVTFTGTLTGGVFPLIKCDSTAGGTARGQATFKVSYDDGATYPHTGIPTAASVALPGIGSAITANFPVATYNTDQTWEPLATQVADIAGPSNHASRATAANCPIIRAAAFNGRPCLDYGVGTAFSLVTPSVSLGASSIFMVLKGDANSGYAMVHKDDLASDDAYLFSTTGASSLIAKPNAGTKITGRNATATWLRDSTRKVICRTFDGTHAGHKIYVNGVDIGATGAVGTADPGTGATTGALYIGSNQTPASSFRGLIAGWGAINRALTSGEVKLLTAYAVGRFNL